MPTTEIRAFRDDKGRVPVRDWLEKLECSEPKAYAKCLARILELEERGFEMRRPHADLLRDGIYELRASIAGTHYRLLYFFFGKNVVVVSHGLTKEDRVPPEDIDLAIERKALVTRSPAKYTAEFEIEE
jgi:phage-related protein